MVITAGTIHPPSTRDRGNAPVTIRFAHIADTHLGAFRDRELRRLNLEAFLSALEVVRDEGAEFLLVAGDMFDTNLPDMATVDRAAAGLRRLRDAGVRVYVLHGSHDRSPTDAGILDVLESAGLFVNVDMHRGEGAGRGPLTVDEPTGAVLTGIGGRRLSLERGLFDGIDGEALSGAAQGAPLAIFAYHGAVEGMLPDRLGMLDTLPVGGLPPGFDYYALGHIHARRVLELPGGGVAAYPGATFGASFTDLADGEAKGVLIVDADDGGRCQVRHVPVEVAPVLLLDVDVDGLPGEEAVRRLAERTGTAEPQGSLVLLRVAGTLASGRPADLAIPRAREDLLARQAVTVHVNRAGLSGPTRSGPEAMAHGGGKPGGDPEEVARRVLDAALSEHGGVLPWTRGEAGLDLALHLLSVLRVERKEASKADREAAVRRQAFALLDRDDRLGAGMPTDQTTPRSGDGTAQATLDDLGGGDG